MTSTNAQPQNAALAQLADIQEPLLANDWYLAPVWWLLAVFVVVVFWLLLRRYQHFQQRQAPRRFALATLSTIDLNKPDAPAQITSLLKRWLLSEAPQHPALAYSGKNWQQFLVSTLTASGQLKINGAPLPDLLALHYQQSADPAEVQRYAAFALIWLQQADLRLSNGNANTAQGVKHV